MPALDILNDAPSTIHDISANVTQSTAAVPLGRGALSLLSSGFTVIVTEASAANFGTQQVRVFLEYSTDNGTTWHPAGVCGLASSAAGVPLQVRSAPSGVDIVPEQNVDTDIDWRATSDVGTVIASADDFTYIVFLGANTGFPADID